MAELLEQHAVNYSEADMLAGMARFRQRLNNVHTGSQLSTIVNSLGHLVPRRHHAGADIHTQPTAASF